MLIDVVIPVFRPDDRLEKCISGLLKQTVPVEKIHLIVTYAKETDKQVLKRYKDCEKVSVSYVAQKEFDHAAVRDDYMNQTTAEYVLFMVQDALPANESMLEELLKPFADGRTGIAYGRHVVDKKCGEIERFTRYFNYPPASMLKTMADKEKLGIKLFFNSNVCALYRVPNYRKTTGFGRRAVSNEDMVIAWKVLTQGDQIAYVADAKVLHYHEYGYVELFQRNFDVGAAHADNRQIVGFVSASGEGLRLVKQTAAYLIRKRKPWLIGELFLKSGIKYAGFQTGKHYHVIPQKMRYIFSRNKCYWDTKKSIDE